jgi:hypothetical protein
VSRIVRAVSAEDVSGASGIDRLPDGRSGAGLYAIEQASRIWRNEHHLRQPAHRKKIGTQSENRPARRWIDSGVIT